MITVVKPRTRASSTKHSEGGRVRERESLCAQRPPRPAGLQTGSMETRQKLEPAGLQDLLLSSGGVEMSVCRQAWTEVLTTPVLLTISIIPEYPLDNISA